MIEQRLTRAEAAKHHIEDPAAFESTDTSPRGVLIFIGGLFAGLAITLAFLVWLWGFLSTGREPVQPYPTVQRSQVPPEPRIQSAPQVEFRAFRAQEDAILNSYGWANKSAGVARIPIGRAMDLIVARGLPVRSGAGPVPTAPATGEASGGPQTGPPVPRGNVPPGVEKSVPLRGLPEPGVSPSRAPAMPETPAETRRDAVQTPPGRRPSGGGH